MKRMFQILLLIVGLFILYVVGNISFAYLTKFKPQTVEQISSIESTPAPNPISDSVFSFMIWNIGYGGLGAETDFFYDGGKMVTSPKEWVQKYNEGILKTIEENKDADFILLQECDRAGKRSWNTDQVKNISTVAKNHFPFFTVNYDVRYLPFPWTEPIGRVYGGLLSMSNKNYVPTESKRIALPGITDFPRKLFYLERCLLFQRYKLQNGKDLIVVNTHYEAYDDGGVKKQQMALTREWVEKEYKNGNYVIIGGDWNIAPPDFDVTKWQKERETDSSYLKRNEPNLIDGWKYAYDANTATNRKNSFPFDPNKTFTTVIDYFYVSPNVEVIETKGINAGFKNSDHNPVRMKIKLM